MNSERIWRIPELKNIYFAFLYRSWGAHAFFRPDSTNFAHGVHRIKQNELRFVRHLISGSGMIHTLLAGFANHSQSLGCQDMYSEDALTALEVFVGFHCPLIL